MSFDFDGAFRWARFDPRKVVARRPDADLPFVDPQQIAGNALLLDTCVYVDQLRKRTPQLLDQLMDVRMVNHSAVAVQELMHAVGALDPKDHRTPATVAEIRGLILSMPPYRRFAPDIDVLGRAALLSGILCRLQGYGADRKFRALSDSILFFQAQKLGFTVLTGNIADFDILMQLLPAGRVLFYRRR